MSLTKIRASVPKKTSTSISLSNQQNEVGSVIYIVPKGRVFVGEIRPHINPDTGISHYPFINGESRYNSNSAREVVRLSGGDQVAVGDDVNNSYAIKGDEYAI